MWGPCSQALGRTQGLMGPIGHASSALRHPWTYFTLKLPNLFYGGFSHRFQGRNRAEHFWLSKGRFSRIHTHRVGKFEAIDITNTLFIMSSSSSPTPSLSSSISNPTFQTMNYDIIFLQADNGRPMSHEDISNNTITHRVIQSPDVPARKL